MKLSNFYKFISVGFPAGYRFISVFFVGFLASASVVEEYSQAFLMVSLLATFSGFAVSSQAYMPSRDIRLFRKIVLVLLFLAPATMFCWPLWSGSVESYIAVVIATLFYSVFEVARSTLLAKARFDLLTVKSVVSTSLMLIFIYVFNWNASYLVIAVFFSLCLVSILIGYKNFFGGDRLSYSVLKDVSSYSISNGLSSGLVYIIPLLLVADLGEGSAIDLAQIVVLTSLLFFMPRYLSAGFMVDLQSRQDWQMVVDFEKKLIIFIMLSCLVAGGVLLLAPDKIKYVFLFLAMVFSQMGLPYANVHTALGRGFELLKVNAKSTFVFAIIVVILLLFMNKGEARGQALMFFYFLYMLARNFYTRMSCKHLVY